MGHRYEVAVGRRQRLVIVVQDHGGRQVGVMDDGADEPSVTVPLSHEQAVAVGALLMGARFSIDTTHDERVAGDEVDVETMTVGPGSPAAGRLLSDIALPPDSDAEVLAIIRDETPALVEDDAHTPARPGDRLVVAARRDRIGAVVQHLAG
jgi:K+/H+ antiporter YhaU regulatory subunit KhtT